MLDGFLDVDMVTWCLYSELEVAKEWFLECCPSDVLQRSRQKGRTMTARELFATLGYPTFRSLAAGGGVVTWSWS